MYQQTVQDIGDMAAAKLKGQRESLPSHLVRSMLAGMYVGVCIVLIFTIGGLLSKDAPAVVRLVMGICFGGALTFVVFAGSELFTGSNLVLTLGVLTGKARARDLGTNWAWTWVGNLAGSALFLAGALNLHGGDATGNNGAGGRLFAAAGANGNGNGNGAAAAAVAAPASPAVEAEEELPWHDAALKLDERMKLAEGKPYARRLMAAMAQLDCGSCGYLCKTYAEAIATGKDKDLTKCSPSGKETARKLEELAAAEAQAGPAVATEVTVSGAPVAPAAPAAGPPSYDRHHPLAAKLLRCHPLNKLGSLKDTRFVSLDLKGSALTYKVGDALGVLPENAPDMVRDIITTLGASGAEDLTGPNGEPASLYGATPMIMVGPGTGVAPFRAFLQERQATGATDRNWLLFGDQQRDVDFLYREELEAYHRDGFLNRLDTAFSRDQDEKVYVQHRMLENAAQLWAWLKAGAHFYVCGDAKRMATDVDNTLKRIVAEQGRMNPDAARAYVADLTRSKRYQRDVY